MLSKQVLLSVLAALAAATPTPRRRAVDALNPDAAAEAHQRDATATRAFANVSVQAADGRCLFVDPLSGDFRANLTPVQLAACGSTEGQGWDIITAGKHNDQPGQVLLVSTLTQACLNFDSRNGNVNLFSCGGRAAGEGEVTESQLFAYAGRMALSLQPKNAEGQCLVANGDSLGVATCAEGDTTQRFNIGGMSIRWKREPHGSGRGKGAASLSGGSGGFGGFGNFGGLFGGGGGGRGRGGNGRGRGGNRGGNRNGNGNGNGNGGGVAPPPVAPPPIAPPPVAPPVTEPTEQPTAPNGAPTPIFSTVIPDDGGNGRGNGAGNSGNTGGNGGNEGNNSSGGNNTRAPARTSTCAKTRTRKTRSATQPAAQPTAPNGAPEPIFSTVIPDAETGGGSNGGNDTPAPAPTSTAMSEVSSAPPVTTEPATQPSAPAGAPVPIFSTVDGGNGAGGGTGNNGDGNGMGEDNMDENTPETTDGATPANPTTPVPVSRAGGTLDSTAAAEAHKFDTDATRPVQFVSLRASTGECVSVDPTAGDFRQNLIPLALVPCSGAAEQKFDFITAGVHNDGSKPGAALIVSVVTNGCVSTDSRRAADDNVTVFSCGGRAGGEGGTDAGQLVDLKGAKEGESFVWQPANGNGQCIVPGQGRLVLGACGGEDSTFDIVHVGPDAK
ncbi:hypothetical protein ACHAQH_008271 [Verticillium albo-atrum]